VIAVRFVLVGALLTAVSCSNAPAVQEPESTSPQATPTSSLIASLSAVPSPSDATAAADVTRFVRVLLPSWRPSGPTVVVDRRPGVGKGHVMVAVPLSGGAAVDLVAFPSDSPTWDIRPDGSAIVASVNTYCANGACDQQAKRLAVIDTRTGSARWLTAADETRSLGNPLWSPDGAFVYYGAGTAGPQNADLGIFRIRADGTDATRINDPVPPAPASFGQTFSISRPQRVTENGLLFWSAFAGEKGTLKVRDLASGTDRAFVTDSPCVAVVAWRATQPGALVRYGSCQVSSSRLALWDVRTGAQTVLVDSPGSVHDADWDRSATRVVASVGTVSSNATELAIVNGPDRGPIPGTQGALSLRWLSVGIAYTTLADTGPSSSPPDCVFGISDVRFVPTAGGPPKVLFRGCGVGGVVAVNP
jgi:hypothetical protein